MKLRTQLVLSTAAVALMAAPSAQASDLYLSIFGGISTFGDELSLRQMNSTSSSSLAHFLSSRSSGNGLLTFYSKSGFSTYSPSTYYITIFLTSRTIGYYTTVGKVFGSSLTLQNSTFNWNDDFSNGFVVGAAIGMDFNDGWRSELELAYRSADVDEGGRFRRANTGTQYAYSFVKSATRFNYRYLYSSTKSTTLGYGWPVGAGTKTATTFAGSTKFKAGTVLAGSTTPLSGTAVGNFASDGDAQVWSIMANLWYDFDIGDSPIKPFIGGGIGAARLDLEYRAAMSTYFGGTATYRLDDGGWGFAYQLGAGLGLELGGGMRLTAEYRYFASTDIDVGRTDLAVESHNVIVGFSIPLGGS